MKTLTKELQALLTPAKSIELLRAGNRRFLNNTSINRDLLDQVNETSNGQFPFAVILSCIDSRTSSELIFNQGLGDIFSIRVAGNIINEDILGSMEFACKVAGSKVIMVLGHTKCGAIKGACDDVKLGNLTGLINKIKPAVRAEKNILSNRNSSNPEFVQRVSELNVRLTAEMIITNSPILKEMADSGQIIITSGMYNVDTGKIFFFEDEKKSNGIHSSHELTQK
jgi:carbonic anhydrase